MEQRYETTIKVNVWAKDEAEALAKSQELAELLKKKDDNRAYVDEVRTAYFGDIKEGKKVF